MGFFGKLFGSGVDKNALIKDLVRLRVRNDPMAATAGFNENDIESLSVLQLAGLPEATIITIVETWALLHKRGASDAESFQRIEEHRSRAFPRGVMPSPLNLRNYVAYRLQLEHSHGVPINDLFIDSAIEVAKKAYGIEPADGTGGQLRKRPDDSPAKSLPKAQPRPDGLTPCLTPGCTNAPLWIPVTSVFAQVEYQLRGNPRAVVKLSCSQCGRESTYDYGTLLELLPEKLRPTPLPEGVIFAVLLAKVNTSASMPHSYFGERILTRVTKLSESDGWRGRTLGRSQFCARTLPPGTEVVGPVVNEHFVITARRVGPTDVPVEIKEVPTNSCFAIMIVPRNEPNLLLSANPFCPNPSCMNVCSLTFTQFENAIAQGAAQSPDPDTEPHIVWECNMCHTTMMVGVDTFNDLYKI